MSEAITKGSPWLRGVLGEVVWSIAHTRDNYLVAQYRRVSKRRGVHKAVVAVAHTVLVILSSSSSTTCCATTSPTPTWAPTTAINSMPPVCSAIMCVGWSSWATQ